MICAFLSPLWLRCWGKRSTFLSAADGEPTGGRGDLGLETNIHDLHGASASGWTEAILRFKASQNWGLERCKTQDVCNQKDWRISPGEKKHLKSQLLSFRGDSADRLHRERPCCQRRRYCLSDSVDLVSPSSREGFSLLPPSAHHRRFLPGKHVGSSFYIFIKSDANVCSGWHIFMFSSPIAPGCLFQVLLRTGY